MLHSVRADYHPQLIACLHGIEIEIQLPDKEELQISSLIHSKMVSVAVIMGFGATILFMLITLIAIVIACCLKHRQRREMEASQRSEPVHLGWWSPRVSVLMQTSHKKAIQTVETVQKVTKVSSFALLLQLCHCSYKTKCT